MDSVFTRRQALATGICTLITSQTAAAADMQSFNLTTSRKLASWDIGALQCWFEGHAADVSQVVQDAQAIWDERAVFQHIDYQDLTVMFESSDIHSIATAYVGCAQSHNSITATQIAFQRAIENADAKGVKLIKSAILVFSASSEGVPISEFKEACSWIRRHIPDDAHFDMQLLQDDSLDRFSKRVSLAVTI